MSPIFSGLPIYNAIYSLLNFGVPENTIVMLLLLPVIATFIAATRQIVGVRGFGIFLPAALSVAFVAIGPILERKSMETDSRVKELQQVPFLIYIG